MVTKWIEQVTGPLEQKKLYKQYKARAELLPAGYRIALEAIERYLNYFGTGGDGTALYGDLIDLFEQGAARNAPIREIVGEDPVEFVEAFVRNYPKGQWIIRERDRLNKAIDSVAGKQG